MNVYFLCFCFINRDFFSKHAVHSDFCLNTLFSMTTFFGLVLPVCFLQPNQYVFNEVELNGVAFGKVLFDFIFKCR